MAITARSVQPLLRLWCVAGSDRRQPRAAVRSGYDVVPRCGRQEQREGEVESEPSGGHLRLLDACSLETRAGSEADCDSRIVPAFLLLDRKRGAVVVRPRAGLRDELQ